VVETVIGPTTSFRGHLRCDGGVRIDGLFEGTIETTGNVVIGEKAKVLADIVAQNVSISGAVKGNITARRVELLSTGHIWGDIKVASFLRRLHSGSNPHADGKGAAASGSPSASKGGGIFPARGEL